MTTIAIIAKFLLSATVFFGQRSKSSDTDYSIAQVPTRKLTVDGFEIQLGTNHCGHFLLNGLLFDRIAKSKGQIVVVARFGYNMGLKTIKFDDMNWDEGYGSNTSYSQSKLAQMMFAYELQDRLAAAGRKDVEVFVCHPGSSATSLITTSGGRTMRIIWRLMTRCCQTNENASQLGQSRCLLCRAEAAPLVESGGSGFLEVVSIGERSLGIEVVADRGMNGCELLQTSHLPKPLHRPFSSSERKV